MSEADDAMQLLLRRREKLKARVRSNKLLARGLTKDRKWMEKKIADLNREIENLAVSGVGAA